MLDEWYPAADRVLFVLDNLSSGVTLRNRSGRTHTGSPFIRLPGGLNAGQQLLKLLDFANPHHVAIRFRLRVLAGLGAP